MDLFDIFLSVSKEDLELELRGFSSCPWTDFLLNPRRLRGSDFLMRWSQGVWSEERLIRAVNETGDFYAIPYGPSGTAPTDDVRAFELYFERLESAGLKEQKRPDLLIFDAAEKNNIKEIVKRIGGVKELPFTSESDLQEILGRAILAVECENSLWIAENMPDFGSALRPMRRLGGRPGLKKNAVLPTVILKEEDRKPLLKWQRQNGLEIHIWHVFYDRAYGLSLREGERLIREGLIVQNDQTFQAPGGATTKKGIYKFYYHYAYPLAVSVERSELVAAYVEDKNGHILPYVKFEGGKLRLLPEAIEILRRERENK